LTQLPANPPAEPARLALLYRVSQAFNSTLDLDQVLDTVMDEVIASVRAERGFLMLREPDGHLTFRAARGMDQHTLAQPEFQVSRGIVERVAKEGRPLLTSNAMDDDRLSGRESINILGLRAVLCVPLVLKGTAIGVVYVDNRLRAGIFSPADMELLAAIAANAAVAIENARLYQVAVEKGRLERELQVARDVQTSLLPRGTPQVPGWEFAAHWQPAREVAGDFYDFVPLSGDLAKCQESLQGPGHPRLGIVIADVADKGMPAALFMALTRSTVRASLISAATPAAGLAHANRLICADAAEGMFVTLFYAELDPKTAQLTYVNCGHNPPVFYQAASGELTRLMPTGIVLGVEEDTTLEEKTIRLEPGDLVVMYTDGFTEAIDKASEQFGEGRLQAVVRENSRRPPAEIIAALQEALAAFAGTLPPFDDRTIVVIKKSV
jgi:sigma-B regulation protein RsbU (phosphoserine phosphatase)